MVATACGLDRCGSPTPAFLSCVEKNLNDLSWQAQRELLKQHMHALVFFARNPSLLPPGPRFESALPEFRAATLRLADSLRTEAGAAHGALDNPLPGAVTLAESLDAFLGSLDDNLLSMGVTFLEEGELSLYGETLQQRLVTTKKQTSKLGQKEEGEEEGSAFGLRVAGEIVALSSAIHKEVLRAFARRIAAGAEFGQVFGGGSAPLSVASWLGERYSDFRKFIYPSYVIDAHLGCLQQCVEPLLADNRLQTGCTDDRGRPQPLVKCADPAEQFNKIMRKSIWESSLGDWLKKGKAHAACQQLVQQLNEDEAAWAQQVNLMFTHLDTNSYGRFSIKLSMVTHLYDMFASTSERPSMSAFIEWLVELKMPLPQSLQTPTSEALLVAGVHFHTQVSVGKAFKLAVKEDPTFSQCKPEETRIISELIPSLSSLFSTLSELNDFLSQQRKQEDVVTRVVAAPPAADARPTLEQVMTTFAAAPRGSAEVLVRLPIYFPGRVASSFSKGGPQALQVLDYTYTIMPPSYSRELGSKALSTQLVDVTEDAEGWVARNVAACLGTACTAQQAGDRGVTVSIEHDSTATATYTFPATREERAASSVFSWLLPRLLPLRCKLPVSAEQGPIIPILLPPVVPPPMGALTGEGSPLPEEKKASPPTAEEAAEERESGEQPAETVEQVQPETPEKLPEEPLELEKLPADPDKTDPEELVTARPKRADEGPQLDPEDDACHTLMRLYYKYIEGKALKDVDTLYEEAMKIPLFRKTRQELRLEEKDLSMQSFRLALCVTCGSNHTKPSFSMSPYQQPYNCLSSKSNLLTKAT
ncbi:hypothetical protein ACSSS7_004781 [Eimeria intestinalis]